MDEPSLITDADIFSRVLENIETGIIILDMVNRRVFYRNRHAGTILGFLQTSCDFEELSGMMFSGLEQVIDSKKTRSKRTMLNCDHRTFGYTIYRLEDESQYVAVIIRDITDQSRLEAIDEASEMMNNISYVFSGIRHEIGNPLNSIKMALTVLKNNLGKLSKDEVAVYLERMADDAKKMETLLKSFKNFNMFEKPKTVSVNLQEFFESLTQLLGADVRKKKIKIHIDILPEGRWVSVDTRALQHVAMNILANALDALDGCEGPVLKIMGEAVGDVVLLSIKDNGCGMPDDLIENAFKPFYTTKPHGTGLGLVISKKMLSQMNCGIQIDSERGKGTTVTLSMPKSSPQEWDKDFSEAVYHQ